MDHIQAGAPDLAGDRDDVQQPPSHDTRFRFLERIAVRAARPLARRRALYRKAVVAGLGQRIARSVQEDLEDLDRESTPAGIGRQRYVDRLESIASLRSELVNLQQQMVELGRSATFSDEPSGVDPGDKLEEPRPTGSGRIASVPESGQIPGVNVFGDWAATTGLAQAARRLTVALSDAGFDLSLRTIRSGAPVDQGRVPEQLNRIPDDRRHPIDVWMLNVNEFPAVSGEMLRPPGQDTYSIGVWYWELPTFPDGLVAQMERVDEIWVATKFVQSSFRRASTRPVHIVPAIVPELKGSGRGRRDFGLSDGEAVFMFSFDVNSMVARKNPGAVVEAFGRAFPAAASSGCRLVIKVLNLARSHELEKWLRSAVAGVNGVLIDDDMADDELVDLFMCSDVYVSLHRSEGFGFGIAEAMALGKPVVTTAYSGNLDFATAANSFQVGYRMREITSADHVFNEETSGVYPAGALWAEPDVDQAARWMRLLASDPVLRRSTGEKGRATIRNLYSAEAAVRVVTDRLSEISARTGKAGS